MMAVDNDTLRMMAALLAKHNPPKRTPEQNALRNALAPRSQPPVRNWLHRPLPMEGRFGLLPIKESVPGMGPSVFNKREAALPGLLAGAVNAFTAPGRALDRGAEFNPEQEAVNFGMTFMGSGLLGSRVRPAPRGSVGMNAYHGSPHKFDAFDMSKIGTGEGAQAYGHGLYFAESPGIARSYQVNLTAVSPADSKAVSALLPRRYQGSNDSTRRIFKDITDALANGEIKNAADYLKEFDVTPELLPAYRTAAELVGKRGAFYHVDIPDEAVAKMLDWDKPLSQQPESVRKAIASLPEVQQMISVRSKILNKPADPSGRELYAVLSGWRQGVELSPPAESARAASAKLNSLGVPGIRYLDAGSRGAGTGTRNIVLFDDKLAKIKKRE